MARFTNGINGPVLGKVGVVVGSTWKGKPYLKSKPIRRIKKKGPQEQINQSNFATLHYWLKPILRFLRVGFRGYSETVEGFNAAKSVGLKNAFTGEKDQKVLDPALVQVSWGDLPLPDGISMAKTGNHEVSFSWDGETYIKGADPRDQVMLLAYNDVAKISKMELCGQFRRSGSDKLALPKEFPGTYHVYIAFVAHDRSRQSVSVYLGSVEVPE